MEKTMKRLYLILVALLLVAIALPADAAWNIRQKDTGAAVWIDQNDVEIPVGPGVLHVQLTSLSSTITHYVVSHKKGKLKKVYGVGNGSFGTGSSSPVLHFLIAAAATNKYVPLTTGTTGRLTMATTVGLPSSVTMTDQTQYNLMSLDVEQGGTIAIYAATPGTVTHGISLSIVIE
jgi:hypothetical protein